MWYCGCCRVSVKYYICIVWSTLITMFLQSRADWLECPSCFVRSERRGYCIRYVSITSNLQQSCFGSQTLSVLDSLHRPYSTPSIQVLRFSRSPVWFFQCRYMERYDNPILGYSLRNYSYNLEFKFWQANAVCCQNIDKEICSLGD